MNPKMAQDILFWQYIALNPIYQRNYVVLQTLVSGVGSTVSAVYCSDQTIMAANKRWGMTM
jgi:hypothetical protein